MLEITVQKLVDEFGTDIKVLIKQLYQFTLSKDNIDIHMPSIYRPVFSFRWSINTVKHVYKKQMFILKDCIQNNINYAIIFNHTDGYHAIEFKDSALIFSAGGCEYGDVTYWIPIQEHRSQVLIMIDQIAEIYPDEALPEIFKYSLQDFPVLLVSPAQYDSIILECFYNNYNTQHKIRIPRMNAHQLLAWLNDQTLDLPPGMTFNTNTLNIQYYDGLFCTSSSIDFRIFDKLKSVLANL